MIHLDHGKSVFTFARRSDRRAIRIGARPEMWGSRPPEIEELHARVRAGIADDDDRRRFWSLQQQRSDEIMTRRADELYDVRDVDIDIPFPARIMSSIPCESCGEQTMETRITLLEGRRLCRPCFAQHQSGRAPVEQPAFVRR